VSTFPDESSPDVMMTQSFGAFAPQNDRSLDANPGRNNSSVGRPVSSFGRRRFCWEAKGSHRVKFIQEIRPKIIDLLESHLASNPGTDRVTLSLYMVGRSTSAAKPTIMIISRNGELRKGVRKTIKESEILSHQYPEYGTEYVNKDPGTSNIMPLTSGSSSNRTILATEAAKTILYDASIPMATMGLAVYISDSSSLRPATANLVRTGDQILFQTVHHAFRAVPVGVEMAPVIVGEDLVIDSDSETEDDHDNEAQVELTSAGSQSTDTISYFESPYSGHSRRSSFTPRTSTLTSPARGLVSSQGRVTDDIALDDAFGQISMATGRMHDAIANLADFARTDRKFVPREPALPSLESLSLLGELVNESMECDLALIKITNQKLKKTLGSLLRSGRVTTLAYDSIARNPEDDSKVYTCTASGGKIFGTLSSSPSYTRLSDGTSFQKVYIVRLDGPLAKGDCGSVVIDAKTGGTYGHLVAGCRTTGIAYIIAADQIAEDITEALPEELTEVQRLMNAFCGSPNTSPLPELRSTSTHQSKVRDTLADTERIVTTETQSETSVNDRRYLRTMHTECNKRLVPGKDVRQTERMCFYPNHTLSKTTVIARKLRKSPRKDRLTKRWRPIFSVKRLFDDIPFLEARESILGFEREGGPLDAFLEDADSSIPSWEINIIREFLQTKEPQSGGVRNLARARLDDREYNTAYQRKNPEWLTSSDLREFLSLPVLLPCAYTL
jgi:hypothetical protein